MIIEDKKGNVLLDIIKVDEAMAEIEYAPITHALAVVKVGEEYLLGWNKWRSDWEIFGGCKEDGETIRECVERECLEELGISDAEFTYLGLMYYDMVPGYFNPEKHFEYGALYGVQLPEGALDMLEKYRMDKEEIGELSFYSQISDKKSIAVIDKKLLEEY